MYVHACRPIMHLHLPAGVRPAAARQVAPAGGCRAPAAHAAASCHWQPTAAAATGAEAPAPAAAARAWPGKPGGAGALGRAPRWLAGVWVHQGAGAPRGYPWLFELEGGFQQQGALCHLQRGLGWR